MKKIFFHTSFSIVESSHNLLLKRVAGAHIRLLSLPYLWLFAFSGYFLSLCLPYTQSHFSAWVYSLISSSLYPRFFSLLGIHIVFVSLYPSIFTVLGIHTVFYFSIPKVFPYPGYISDFCIQYTQTSIFICV